MRIFSDFCNWWKGKLNTLKCSFRLSIMLYAWNTTPSNMIKPYHLTTHSQQPLTHPHTRSLWGCVVPLSTVMKFSCTRNEIKSLTPEACAASDNDIEVAMDQQWTKSNMAVYMSIYPVKRGSGSNWNGYLGEREMEKRDSLWMPKAKIKDRLVEYV